MLDDRKWYAVVVVLAIIAIIASSLTAVYSADLSSRTKEKDSLTAEREMSDSLLKLSSLIQTELSHIEMITLNAASELRGQDLNGTAARGVLASLIDSDPNIINAITADKVGIVLAVEPSEYSGFEGTDVSNDVQVMDLLYAGRSFMSPLTTMYQGYGGVVIAAPILDSQNKIAGMLSAMFRPDQMIENLTVETGLDVKLSAMALQKDGVILYDLDANQVGRNTFTDPLFQNFTEIKSTASRMVNESYGGASYSFYLPGNPNPVNKEIIWTTVSSLGVDWTVAINRAV